MYRAAAIRCSGELVPELLKPHSHAIKGHVNGITEHHQGNGKPVALFRFLNAPGTRVC
jgi:hypothetical protein